MVFTDSHGVNIPTTIDSELPNKDGKMASTPFRFFCFVFCIGVGVKKG